MADITNAEAIRYVNEVVRPMAERMRALKAEVDAALITWKAGLNAIIGTSADDDIADGREDEGVSRLTAADIAAFGAQMIAYQTQLEQPGVPEAISKPCVRALQAN